LTSDDLEQSKFKVIKITRQISKNGERCDDWVNSNRIGNYPWAIDWQHDF